jgi:4-cresol dehydrogenase (hydroxylating)
MPILPPGVSARDFTAATRAFEEAVGRDWVFTSDEDVNLYRDPFSTSWGESDELIPSAAVAPANVEQVQAVVRAANRYKVPLYPIATGKNFAYGGPAPNLRGAVVVDLKRMNRVLELDADRYTCLVEPGVSYFDLYRAIQDRGLKLWIDNPSPGWGSPMGNALDHGIGHTMGRHRDHFGSHCGIEAVLANGEVMRTGMGAMPGAGSWQDYPYGYGPDVAGLFGQANFGIVTKMGFWLYPQPESYFTGQVTVPRRRDLDGLVKAVNYLEQSYLIGEPIFGSPLRQAVARSPGLRDLVGKRGGVTDAALDRAAADENLHIWSVDLQFYGPERTNRANWEFAKARIAALVPGAKFYEGQSLKLPVRADQLEGNARSAVPTNVRLRQAFGVPDLSVWASVSRSDASPEPWRDGHVGFSPILPRTAEAVFEAQEAFVDLFHELKAASAAGLSAPQTVNHLSTPQTWFQRAFIFITTLPTARFNPEINRNTREAMTKLIELGAKHGWGEYRCPPAFQDAVVNAYSFNNHALRRFHEALKDAADPNGVLAPGRGGIWPKRYRRSRA